MNSALGMGFVAHVLGPEDEVVCTVIDVRVRYVHSRTSRGCTLPSVHRCPLPETALLTRYARGGAYTDCYATEIPGVVSHKALVSAFYTTVPFKLERWILEWAVQKPSTDSQAADLASGLRDDFAAWRVEARADNQLLLSDHIERTRSWLMTVPIQDSERVSTRLYFGSAIVPVTNPKTGISELGLAFRALLGFHKMYSLVLLRSAASRLARRPSAE